MVEFHSLEKANNFLKNLQKSVSLVDVFQLLKKFLVKYSIAFVLFSVDYINNRREYHTYITLTFYTGNARHFGICTFKLVNFKFNAQSRSRTGFLRTQEAHYFLISKHVLCQIKR